LTAGALLAKDICIWSRSEEGRAECHYLTNVVKNLPEDHNISGWQFIFCEIQNPKVNADVFESFFVETDHGLDNVTSDISVTQVAKLASNEEVTAPEIDDVRLVGK
jgi:hypothetical protein